MPLAVDIFAPNMNTAVQYSLQDSPYNDMTIKIIQVILNYRSKMHKAVNYFKIIMKITNFILNTHITLE